MDKRYKHIILGAGVTGLAVGFETDALVLERETHAGGICTSYYMSGTSKERHFAPSGGEQYRFENGGGHWLFGGDDRTIRFVNSLSPLDQYERKSSVYLPSEDLFIPYPLQNNLRYLPLTKRQQIIEEVRTLSKQQPPESATLKEEIEWKFGPTLTEIFFGPFHELYTTGLWKKIAPQDGYKTPTNIDAMIMGAQDSVPAAGYNVVFRYPAMGLDALVRAFLQKTNVRFGSTVATIDIKNRTVILETGEALKFENITSTLPLNKMMEWVGLKTLTPPDPHTSVLVINLGAHKGTRCPEEHWVYFPQSRSGFHRVGFYSNVDNAFVPRNSAGKRASLYIERSYPGGEKPSQSDIDEYTKMVLAELQDLQWISDVEVVYADWIEVAYTWSWSGSNWKREALSALQNAGIQMRGRYGRWHFQGIMESIKEGWQNREMPI